MRSDVKQAVIMVGGKGTRLMPLTKYKPKPMLPVLDKPCIKYLIESMAASGIKEIILACGYRSTQLAEAIGDGSDIGVSIEYSYEDEPLGTGGAIKQTEGCLDDVFIAANGDVFADISLEEQINTHFTTEADVTISLTPVSNPREFGIARLDDEGRIVEFKEKPEEDEVFSNLINAGIYVVNKDVLSYIPDNQFFDLSKDLFPILMNEGKRLQGHRLNGIWRDVGRPADLFGANLDVATKEYNQMNWGGSQVGSSSIRKPFYLGKGSVAVNCDIFASVILENSSITDSKLVNSMVMKDCVIDSADIENSIIGAGCKICPGATIINSVTGDGVTVEAGRKVENERIQE